MFHLSKYRLLTCLPPSLCPCWDLQSLNPPTLLTPLASSWLYGSASPHFTPESNTPECPPQHFQPSSLTFCSPATHAPSAPSLQLSISQFPGHPMLLESNAEHTEQGHYEFKLGTLTRSFSPLRNSNFHFLWRPRSHWLSSFFRPLFSGHTHTEQMT